jgi:hypothetical protein
MTLFDSSAIQAASLELGIETDNLPLKTVSSVLVHFPPGSSVLLMLEAEGKVVDYFVLSDSAESPKLSANGSRSLSGGYLLEQQSLTDALPKDTSSCTVTIIHTGS